MHKLRRGISIGLIAASMSLSVTGAGIVSAKITPVPIACENSNGHRPPGQQPECKGKGHDQVSENQNPAGKAPPGQNK
jgi:hypothetical protein